MTTITILSFYRTRNRHLNKVIYIQYLDIMLSLASKRTAPISRHYQRLRKTAGILGSPSVRQHRRARLTTAATSSTTKQQQPLVVSRRSWLDFKESRGITKRRPDASKRRKSDDEKPWPRNMQIAGYVAGALTVPYVILWTITSNTTLREWFGPYIPLEKLRSHYGKLEWDAQSYCEEMEDTKNKEKSGKDESQLLIGYYQFPEEAPFHERQRQKIVEAMNESDVKVTLSLSSSLSEEVVTTKIASKTVANAKDLLEYFPSTSNSTNGNTTVAVDFMDSNEEDNDADNLDATSTTKVHERTIESPYDGALMTDADSMANNKTGGGYDGLHDLSLGSLQLTKETQTMSKWAYIPQAAGEGSKKSTSNASSMEIEMGRLKYEIIELEKNLRDPMCTRSIDDMTAELRLAKRDLSRLTWKKRFRFSR